MFILYTIPILLLLLGSILLFLIQRQQKNLGILTQGKRIYQDTREKPGETLYAKTIPLVGKPDYLIEQAGVIIPVEYKSGKTPKEPYQNHTMQLMAYCYLVEEHFGIRPPGGYIRYPQAEFKIAYTDEAKQSVIQTVAEIKQKKLENKELHCPHKNHYQ